MKNKLIALITAAAMVTTISSVAFAARVDIPGNAPAMGSFVSGYVWDDVDSDENFTMGTDTYIQGVEVTLQSKDGNSTLTATTDAYGYYSFESEPGDYVIRFVLPQGYEYHTMKTVDVAMGNGDYFDIENDRTAEFEETVYENSYLTLDSRVYDMQNLTYVEGFVWYDANANGIRPSFNDYEDPNSEGDNEVGIPGAIVTVTNSNGEKIGDVETDERGWYSIDVKPGMNTFTVTLPAEYQDYGFTVPVNGTTTVECLFDEMFVDFGIAQGVPQPPFATIAPNPTATPNPFATTAPDPSASVTPAPETTARPNPNPNSTATPAPEITPAPGPSDMPIPTQMPELNKTEHYAYVVGYPDGMIKPENNITRQEVASIFFRLLTDATRDIFYSKTNTFDDVKADMWSNAAISTMTQAGVITGYKDNTFKPANNITRAEFATIAAKFDSGTYLGPNKFNDIDGHWAAEYINRAAERGWISGYDNGSFRPDAYITRAEAMTLINNVLERHVTEENMLSEMSTWPDNTSDKWYYIPVQEAANSHYYEKYENGYEKWTKMRETRNWLELER